MLVANFPQYALDDFQDICHKCQHAYWGDFISQDCDHCILPCIVDDYAAMRKELEYRTSPKGRSRHWTIDPWELEEDIK